VLGLLQKALHGDALRATPIRYDPVFVLGHWRSGSTFLHELLALDERFGFPTSLECCAPHHCLITERLHPALRLPRLRALKAAAPDLEQPQEDELALLAMGAPTPMWSLAYPGEEHGQAYLSLRQLSLGERERWEGILWHFVRLLTYRNPGKRLVMKSSPHTARLALLARMFPQSRFVHIVRDPHVVFAQTVRMWRQMQAGCALLPAEQLDLESQVLQTLREMYTGFESARDALPSGRFHQISYEQLVCEPLQTLEGCYHATGLGDFERVAPRMERKLAPLAGKRFLHEPLQADSKAAVAEAWGPIFRPWGYDV
jgi:hypothetical protein